MFRLTRNSKYQLHTLSWEVPERWTPANQGKGKCVKRKTEPYEKF